MNFDYNEEQRLLADAHATNVEQDLDRADKQNRDVQERKTR